MIPLRPVSYTHLDVYKRQGIETIMISGDDAKTAAAVAAEVGISQVYAGLLPYEKVDLIEELKREWDYVAMVGDGINDAPSLAEATVGIAMGSGTDITLETADVVSVSYTHLDVYKRQATIRGLTRQKNTWLKASLRV